jgi:PAS domain S-box-containing protein
MVDVKELIEKSGIACFSADKHAINQDARLIEPKSILIVEDELILAEVLKITLYSLGYRVTGIAALGDKAIEMVSETVPDLILMDINLRKGEPSGIETAQRILTRFSIPIIFLSGYDEPTIAKQAMNTPFYGYLRKPVNNRDLQIAIELALVKHKKDMQLKSAYVERDRCSAGGTADLEALNKALLVSERRYHGIFDRSQDGIIVQDADGIILEADEEMAKRLEIPQNALPGRSPAEFVTTDNASAISPHTATLLNGQPKVFETPYVSGSGKMTPAEEHEHYIPWNDGQAVISISRDITERTQAEEERDLKNFAVELSIAGIAIADISGNLTYVNPAFLSMWGYSDRKEVLGRSVGSFWQAPVEAQQVVDALEVRGTWFGEMTGQRKDGTLMRIQLSACMIRNAYGASVGMMGSFLDVTDHKRVEEALKKSDETIKDTGKMANVGGWELDLSTKEISWTEEVGLIHRVEPEYKPKLDEALQFYAPESRGAVEAAIQKAAETGEPFDLESLFIPLGSIHTIWVRSVGRAIYRNGKIVKLAGTFQNIDKYKRIEEALRESNEYLRNLLNNANVPIIIWDPDLRITGFNHAFERLTGCMADKVLGKRIDCLFPGETHERSMTYIGQAMKGEQWETIEIPILRKDGDVRILLWNSANIFNSDQKIIATIAQGIDITYRKQVEEALRESNEYLRNLLNNANVPIIIWDQDFRITGFNHAFERLTGCMAGKVLGKQIDCLFPGETHERSMAHIRQARMGEQWETIEIPILRKDGDVRIVIWNSANIFNSDQKIIATIAQGIDITYRKQVEEALQESETRYRNILEDQTEFICRFLPDERLTFVNESFCTYFGLNRDECIGKRHPVSIPQGDAQKMKNHLAALTPENPVAFITHRICMPSGEVRWHRWSDRAIFDRKGTVIEYQSVGRDITDLKAIETELKNSRESLEKLVVARTVDLTSITEQLRMEIYERKLIEEELIVASNEKDLLLREIHHRVKNNLQLVSSLLDMTKMRTRDPELNTTLTDVMLKIQTMALIHTRLYESKRFDMVDMSRQIQDQMASLSTIYSNKNRKVTNELHCSGIYLPVDQAIPCALIFNEILSNSYKHAFRGRTQGAVVVSARKRKNHLRFIIRDDGIGIPKGFDINLANRLGLKLVRTLAQQQLKGSLTFNSDKGTEVIVEFPMKPNERDHGEDTYC